MKKLILFLFILALTVTAAFSQAPQKFSYQAVVRNESNTLVRGTVGVRVSILQGGVNGTVVYQETHTTTTNINGLMTLQIGGGTMLSGDFATIDWADGPYFLKTETDPSGGTNYIIEGTQQLLSVPYALYAGSAANSFSGSYNDLTDLPQMPDIPTNVSAFNNDAGYITMDSVPEIPTNVSAFVNDAGYVTESTLTTENYITQNDLVTNNYVTSADIPTNVSAFNNDAGYITANDVPAYQVLSISNDTIFLSNGGYAVLPAGFDGDYNSLTNRPNLFSGDYNDLTNQPQIPQVPTNVSAFTNDAGYVTESMLTTENYITQNDLITNNYVTEADIPTNVSAFTNDAGYITMDSIPAIPTVPTNVSAFTNDAGYVTESMLTTENYITQNDLITNNYITTADVPTNVSAFTNDAGYITMDSVPAIPTNVSAFTNDAGYVTESMLTNENYITQNDLITNNYITTADIPTNVSAFTNDAGYITMDSIPAIPTNVSAFTNDVGYVTESMLTTENYITQNDLITNNYITTADIPANVSAFTNDAGYITMDSIPAIPTVPTNISAFINDAGYLTSATVQEAANIPTNVSAFNNDAGYITMDAVPTVPTNVSAFTNDAGYLTSYTETDPQFNAWDKDYNDLINRPQIPEIPANVSAFTNDAGYITMDSVPPIPTNVSAFTNDAGYVTESMLTAENYITQNDLITNNYITTNVSSFINDAGYITMDSVPTIPTNVSAFTNDAGYVTESMLTTENYITQNDLITNNYVTTADIPTNVSAFTNDAGYITMDSIPEIPTVPTNVSAFTNDAGYLTSATVQEAANIPTNVSAFNNDAGYITAADVPAIPTNVSAFTNDAGYITMDSIPAIPTVPTNVSAFVNDAGYLTQATVQEAANIPTNVSAFANDANYITLAQVPAQVNADWNATSGAAQIMNKPTIPTVPTNISAFDNDRGYITAASIPTNVSAFTNDRGYITSASIPTNVSSFVNDRGYITNADIPAQVNADWNATSGAAQIMNKPIIPTVPENVSAFTNDAGYITMDSIPAIPTVPSNVSAFNNDANYITAADVPAQVNADWNATSGTAQIMNKPELFSGDYNDLTNKPTLFDGNYNSLTDAPVIPTNVSELNNDAGYITSYTEQQILSISNDTIYLTGGSFVKLPAGFSGSYNDLTDVPENVSTFTNDAGYLTRDSLENYNLTPSDIQALLDRIEELEQVNELPACSIISTSSHGENGVTVNCKVTASGSSEVIERGICWSTAENPTIGDAHTLDGTDGLGTYILNIGELSTNTTYYIRAYATNATGTAYSNQETFSTVFTCGTATVMDRDSNIYNTVLIGNQCWMKENLRTTKYADGTTISNGSTTSTTIAYWYYPNNDAFYKTTYGLLYNWKAVMGNSSSSSSNPSGVQGICPIGWHVPSDAEWTQLTDYVGNHNYYTCIDPTYFAKALAGTMGWRSSNTLFAVGNTSGDNNATNFSSLPANYFPYGTDVWGKFAYFWSSTAYDSTTVWMRVLTCDGRTMQRSNSPKTFGYSVRCIKD